MIFSWWISDVCIHKMSQIKYKEQKNDSYLPPPCQNVIGKSDKVNIKLKRVDMKMAKVSFYYWKFLYTVLNEYWWVIIEFSTIGLS